MDALLLHNHLLGASFLPESLRYTIPPSSFTILSSFSLRFWIFVGIRTPEQQRAWREKIGLLSIISILMAGVGFLTFGFTEAVCGTPANRFHTGSVGNGSVIIHGYNYDFSNLSSIDTDASIQGNDASFLFQVTNKNCLGLITKGPNSTITGTGNALDWYFPCNIYDQFGTSPVNGTGYDSSANCHSVSALDNIKSLGQVYYTWTDVRNASRILAVFES